MPPDWRLFPLPCALLEDGRRDDGLVGMLIGDAELHPRDPLFINSGGPQLQLVDESDQVSGGCGVRKAEWVFLLLDLVGEGGEEFGLVRISPPTGAVQVNMVVMSNLLDGRVQPSFRIDAVSFRFVYLHYHVMQPLHEAFVPVGTSGEVIDDFGGGVEHGVVTESCKLVCHVVAVPVFLGDETSRKVVKCGVGLHFSELDGFRALPDDRLPNAFPKVSINGAAPGFAIWFDVVESLNGFLVRESALSQVVGLGGGDAKEGITSLFGGLAIQGNVSGARGKKRCEDGGGLGPRGAEGGSVDRAEQAGVGCGRVPVGGGELTRRERVVAWAPRMVNPSASD